MAVVSLKICTEPEWIDPLLQEIQKKFAELVGKVRSVSTLMFELEWSEHLKDEHKKPLQVEHAQFPGLTLFPERRSTSHLVEWDFPVPQKNLKFSEDLFRRHILAKSLQMYDETDCFIAFKVTIISPHDTSLTESFIIKKCPVYHTPTEQI